MFFWQPPARCSCLDSPRFSAASDSPPVKLALVTETYSPEVNGVAMTLQRLVRGLAQRGHEVTVATEWLNRRHLRVETRGGVRILRFGFLLPLYSAALKASSDIGT